MDSSTLTHADTPPAPPDLPLVLPAELTIYTVGELRPAWLDWLGQVPPASDGDAVREVKAAAVDQIDAAGVQLLLSLAQALTTQGRRCEVRDASDVLEAGCAALGLSGWLATHTPPGAAA